MRTTEGGGVLGFVIAFLAFAFGGAVGLPPLVRLLVIAVGVVIAVLSARAETKDWVRRVESGGIPLRKGDEWKVRARAMLGYAAITYC